MKIPIADGFYRSSSLPLDSQRCVNAYPVIAQTEHFERQSLFGTPGTTQIATGASGLCRGGKEMDGVPYFVIGPTLYKIAKTVVDSVDTFSAEALGTIAGSARVSMAENGTQLMVLVPGSTGYIYNHVTDTFSTITDADFSANGNPQYVVFMDSYFVCSTDTKDFIASALNDGSTWNALDFGTAEADPDAIVAPHVHANRLYMLGSETTQGFDNIGGSDFPFQAIPGLVIPKGCYAPLSVVESNNSFMMVGGGENESPAVWAFTGSGYDKISTEGIDFLLGQLNATELAAVSGWTYSERGAHFVGFHLRDTTIVFDVSSGRWHERRTRVYGEDGFAAETSWRGCDPVRAYNRIIVGDSQSAKVGEANLDTFDEYGEEILRYVVTQPLENGGKSFTIPRIEAKTESGAVSEDVSDPVLRMSLSRDAEFFGPERSRKIGKVGERNKRQIWRKNGRFPRQAVMKFSQSDKAKFRIIEVEADVA